MIALLTAVAHGQDKPRLFVNGTGTTDVRTTASAVGGWHWGMGASQSSVSSHDETMELMKTFQQRCPGVALTVNEASADYQVRANHESNQKGLLRKRNQIAVVNWAGDVLFSDNTISMGDSVQKACTAITSDWSKRPVHRPEAPAAPAPQPQAVSPPAPAQQRVAAVPASKVMPNVQPVGTPIAAGSSVYGSVVTPGAGESVADAARRYRAEKAKQQAAEQKLEVNK